MGLNPEKDAERKARTRQKIVEAGFRVFSENSIGASNLTDVARAAGVATCTVYSYFSTKEELALGISSWMWKKYAEENDYRLDRADKTGCEGYESFLDFFIDLYRNHRDILRFFQFFVIYMQRADISTEALKPFRDLVGALAQDFHAVYEKGRMDGTLRADVPEIEMFSRTVHLMLAVATRFAFGLMYEDGNMEKELLFEKELLLQAYRG